MPLSTGFNTQRDADTFSTRSSNGSIFFASPPSFRHTLACVACFPSLEFVNGTGSFASPVSLRRRADLDFFAHGSSSNSMGSFISPVSISPTTMKFKQCSVKSTQSNHLVCHSGLVFVDLHCYSSTWMNLLPVLVR